MKLRTIALSLGMTIALGGGTAGAKQDSGQATKVFEKHHLEVRILPLLKGFNDKGLADLSAKLIDKQYKGNEDVRACVTGKLLSAVTLELDEKWKAERALRNTFYGIYLSAEAATGMIIGLHGRIGGLLVRTIRPSGHSGIGFVPFAEFEEMGVIGSAAQMGTGLVFVGDGSRLKNLTLRDLGDTLSGHMSSSDGEAALGLGTLGAEFRWTSNGGIPVHMLGLNMGPQLYLKLMVPDADLGGGAGAGALKPTYRVITDDVAATEADYAETVEAAEGKTSPLNPVAKLVVFLEVRKAIGKHGKRIAQECEK